MTSAHATRVVVQPELREKGGPRWEWIFLLALVALCSLVRLSALICACSEVSFVRPFDQLFSEAYLTLASVSALRIRRARIYFRSTLHRLEHLP